MWLDALKEHADLNPVNLTSSAAENEASASSRYNGVHFLETSMSEAVNRAHTLAQEAHAIVHKYMATERQCDASSNGQPSDRGDPGCWSSRNDATGGIEGSWRGGGATSPLVLAALRGHASLHGRGKARIMI